MESLLYYGFWAGFFILMMRFGCGSHVMGHGHGHKKSKQQPGPDSQVKLKWEPPESDIDPVCKKTVKPNAAKPSVHEGDVYYFCSRECREVFEAAPQLYAGQNRTEIPKLENSHAELFSR